AAVETGAVEAASEQIEVQRPPVSAERVAALEAEVAAAPNKTYVWGKVKKAIATQPDSELLARLDALNTDIQAQVDERRAQKLDIISRAQAMQESNQWKATGDNFKALFDEWKQIGATGRESDDELWAQFQGAREVFNKRRAAYFEERQQVW